MCIFFLTVSGSLDVSSVSLGNARFSLGFIFMQIRNWKRFRDSFRPDVESKANTIRACMQFDPDIKCLVFTIEQRKELNYNLQKNLIGHNLD